MLQKKKVLIKREYRGNNKNGHKKSIVSCRQKGYTRFCMCSTVLEQTMVFTLICIKTKSDQGQPDVIWNLKLREYHIRTSTFTAVHNLTSLCFVFSIHIPSYYNRFPAEEQSLSPEKTHIRSVKLICRKIIEKNHGGAAGK